MLNMSKTYIILASILIILAGGLLLLPDMNRSEEMPPELLLKEINDPARYVTADLVAERLINEDPAILLVDVRSPEESNAFTLPGSVNIPLVEIDDPEWRDYLAQDYMDVVFYSNGDIHADQAWILCTRQGYKNLYVMAGGLNRWFTDIMQPEVPPATAASEEFDRYAFRKAASAYFSGGKLEVTTHADKPEPVILEKRKKKTVTEGGC
jgi:rhodanese-related sulfurtransferase